jgi:tetratricopeptide (TPR) repeat protein
MRPARDPSGILGRVPELEALCTSPSVRRAIERGDPFAVYRALFWGRIFFRFGREQRATLEMLLANRRLFWKPSTGAPWLFSYNGIGTTVYGQDEVGEDRAYVITHFIVFVFIPIYPLAAFLVADAGHNRWQFFARVPLGTFTYLWNRLVVLGILGAVLLGIGSTIDAGFHAEVHVVNGLPVPIAAELGPHRVHVAAGSIESVAVEAGDVAIVARTEDGREVDRGTLTARGGWDALVWNVAGAAAVYHEEVVYRAGPRTAPDGEIEVHCGERAIAYESVDYLFRDPPSSVSLRSRSDRAVRTVLAVAPGGITTCASWLEEDGRLDDAIRMLELAGALAPDDERLATRLVELVERAQGIEAAIAIARRLRDAAPSGLVHRPYQEVMVRAGRRAEVRQEYAERALAAPGSLDAEHIHLRLVRPLDAIPQLRALRERDPSHVGIRRTLAYALYLAGRYEEAAAEFESLHYEAPAEIDPVIEAVAASHLAIGRRSQALEMVSSRFDRVSDENRMRMAIAYGRAAGGPETTALLARFPLDEREGRSPWLRFYTHSELAISDYARLEPDLAAVFRASHQASSDPTAALDEVTRAADELYLLDSEVWALLYAEASRRDPAGPAASALRGSSFAGAAAAAAIARYVHEGGAPSEEIEHLPPGVRACVWLVRSRVADVGDEERAALRARAVEEDLFGDVAERAASGWPPP